VDVEVSGRRSGRSAPEGASNLHGESGKTDAKWHRRENRYLDFVAQCL